MEKRKIEFSTNSRYFVVETGAGWRVMRTRDGQRVAIAPDRETALIFATTFDLGDEDVIE